jgi:WD40 repeat protein
VAGVAFSPDGSRLATAGGATGSRKEKDRPPGELKLWDVGTGRVVLDVNEIGSVLQDVCFSPDGKRLAGAGRDGTVRLWDADTGKELRTFPGHDGGANAVAFSPDGRRLASGGDDAIVRVWDADGLLPVRSGRGHRGPVKAVAFSPDGLRVASGEDRAVKVWERFGRELATYSGQSRITSVAFSPDGLRLAAAAWPGGVTVWDAAVPPGSAFPPLRDAWAVAFSPDGGRLVTDTVRLGVAAEQFRVWDGATGSLLLNVPGQREGLIAGVAFRPDSKEIALVWGEGPVTLWDAATGRLVRRLAVQASDHDLCYSPDGTRLAVRTRRSTGETVQVLETATGREVFSRLSPSGSLGLAFSPDGRRLAIPGDPGRPDLASIVDLATRRSVVTFSHGTQILALAWHRDRVATLGSDGSVKVWDAATGKPKVILRSRVRTVPRATENLMSGGLAFSPDGERLAAVADAVQGKVLPSPHPIPSPSASADRLRWRSACRPG